METELLQQRYQEALVIVSDNTEAISIALLAIVLGAIWVRLYFKLSRKQSVDGGTVAMGRPIDYTKGQVTFSKVEKRLILDMATDYLEEKRLFGKLSKSRKQRLYKKIGLVCDIPELVPPGDTKARIKSLRKHLNGNGKPVDIPGDKPVQVVEPNDLTKTTKELELAAFKSLFKPKAA